MADFAVPETIIFKISLISTRSPPPTAGSARRQSVRQHCGLAVVPEIRNLTLKTDQASSGAPQFHTQNGSSSFQSPPHFQAQNGSSSFRSPTFSRLIGSSFRSPCPFFTLPRHIPTKIWGEYPPDANGHIIVCAPLNESDGSAPAFVPVHFLLWLEHTFGRRFNEHFRPIIPISIVN